MTEPSATIVPDLDSNSTVQIKASRLGGFPRKHAVSLSLLVLAMAACGFILAQGPSAGSDPQKNKGLYEASTKLMLSLQPAKVLSDSVFQRQDEMPNYQIFQKTQAALVKSRLVLNRALKQPAVAKLEFLLKMEDPVDWLTEQLEVDFKESPEIMRLSLTGDKPQELSLLLQAVTDTYLDLVINDDMIARTDRVQRLRDIALKYEEEVRAKRQTFKNLAKAVDSGNDAFKLEVNRQLLADFKHEISRLRISKIALQAKMNRLNKQGDRGARDAANKLQAEIDEKDEQEKLLMESGGNITAQMKELARTDLDLESLRKELQHTEEMAKKLRAEVERATVELHAPGRVRRIGDATPEVKKRKN